MNTFLYDLLLSGADTWNQYRIEHPRVGPPPSAEVDPAYLTDESKRRFHSPEEYDRWARTFIDIDFDSADCHDLVWRGYNLEGAIFSNADCRNLRLQQCNADCADFQGAQLYNCRFLSCSLLSTMFHGCHLHGTRFIGCRGVLFVNPQTSFHGAVVIDSDLSYWCLETVHKDATEFEFSITEMTLKEDELVPTDAEVKIGEGSRID